MFKYTFMGEGTTEAKVPRAHESHDTALGQSLRAALEWRSGTISRGDTLNLRRPKARERKSGIE